MRRGQGWQDSCKSGACSKIFVMNVKDPSGRRCNDSKCANEMSGLVRGGRGVKIMGILTKQGAHQPVPWKGINVERG
jgi:hypothetical protein